MKFLSTLSLVVAMGVCAWAQSVKVTKGDLSFLKGETRIGVEYTYDNMKVGKKSETDYLAEKVEKYNKDEAGRGDKWKEAWVNDRSTRFQPQFEELFDKYASKLGMTIGEDGKYKMVFHTSWTEPGYNVYVSQAYAQINAEISFVEIATGTEKAKMTITNCPGRTFGAYDFDTGVRIQECYALAGKSVAKYFSKALKK